MKGILADLLIKLGLDSKEFNKGIDGAKKKTNTFASGIKALGGMMAAAFSVAAIAGFIKSIVAAGKEQIRVENELGAAIKANGKDVQSNLRAYKAFASQMQRNSTVGDETTLSLIRLAETMQSKAPMEAAKNAIALSKALGIDLNTATKMAVLAQNDLYTMLERYSPSLRNANNETEKAIEYNKLISSGLSIMSEELNTAAGKQIQLSNRWGDFKEVLGTVILQSKTLFSILDITTNKFQVLTSGNVSWWKKAIVYFDLTGKSAKILADQLNKLEDEEAKASAAGIKNQSEFKNLLGEINISAEEYNKKVKAAYDLWDKNNEKVQLQRDLLDSINNGISDYEKKLKSFESIDLTPIYDTSGITGAISSNPLAEEQTTELFDTEKYKQSLDNFAAFKQDFAYMVQDFSIEVVDQLGMAFGELLKNGEFPADFGKNILSIIGGFISQLGKMLIGLGAAALGFQELLKSAFASPPAAVAAIAAGAALVLLGGAIKGFAQAGPTGSGASGGGGYSVTSQSYSTAKSANSGINTNGKIELSAVLKGDSIFLSNQRNTYKRAVVG